MASANDRAQLVLESNSKIKEVNREELQAAITKAVELRALHAALVQGNSPASAAAAANSRHTISSASPHLLSQYSSQDYPVFTPSYDDERAHGYQSDSRTLSECWDYDYVLGEENVHDTVLSDYRNGNVSSRNGYLSQPCHFESHICPADDHKSVSILRTSPGGDFYKSSRRNSLGDFKTISSCNKCKPAAIISSEADSYSIKNSKSSNIVVPLTDSHSSVQPQKKKTGLSFSRLFTGLKKKKNSGSPNRTEFGEFSQVLKGFGTMSVESLKKELMEATETRDAALTEAAEMKTSLGELKHKLEYLETYCEELKLALRQAIQTKDTEKLGNLPIGENVMPVTDEVMVEGFLQIVSESRLSVKQFCKTLVSQIEENDDTLMDNLNLLLQPYKLSLNSKYSKAVLYHLEAIVNQSLFQDFENCVFRKNGSPKLLDPNQDRRAKFSSFVGLRNLSWNEVLSKGTKFYSEDFSKFCDQKMSGIIATLSWTRPWSEQLLQSFFVAAKCMWLLHLLAFSFDPALRILRVEENRSFDSHYMEDVFVDRQRSQGPSRVKVMVMPGFYVQDRVLRCKVLCRYRLGGFH